MLSPQSFADDLRAARGGDRAAMDRLLNNLRPWVERAASRHADRPSPDASSADLVQQASLQAWLKLAQFHGHDDPEQELKMFHKWLEQIVKRLSQNDWRRAQALRRGAGPLLSLDGTGVASAAGAAPAAERTASSIGAGAEAAHDVRAALAELPDATDRLILHECFFAGHSLREVAEALDIDRETLRRRFHALLELLREKLAGHF